VSHKLYLKIVNFNINEAVKSVINDLDLRHKLFGYEPIKPIFKNQDVH